MAFQTLILDNGPMRKALLLFTLLFSSVWGNELGRLHQKAEGAFRNKKFDEALLSYEDLLSKVSTSGAKKYRVGWPLRSK